VIDFFKGAFFLGVEWKTKYFIFRSADKSWRIKSFGTNSDVTT